LGGSSLFLTPTSVAQAQSAHIDVRAGALRLAQAGEVHLRPRLALAVGVPLIGPIEATMRVSAVARDIPFVHPTFGLAAGLALRPEFRRSRVAPVLEIYAGRAQLRGEQGKVGIWTVDGALGVGLRLTSDASLELRVERHVFLGMPTSAALADRAWAGSVGLSVAW